VLILIDATEPNQFVEDRGESIAYIAGLNYERFCPKISKNLDLDETNDMEIINMMVEVRKDIERHKEQFDKIAHHVLQQ
jgi:hypothetical protein